MSISIINAENHNDFRIVPAKSNIGKQFILKRYGYSYTIIDDGQTHYFLLCQNMSYPFGVEPGYYKADIKGDSIHLEYITKEEYIKCNPQEDKSNT
mgnify:CR=1 FL=1|tara:strand:+ start:325 stop:612 length:288 start_codon:yes stop_codon:yes gene_type:complete